MKILITVDFYDPSIGGAQKVVKEIAEGLSKKKHQVTVATTKLQERENKTLNGVKIKEFNIKGNLISKIEGETEKYIKLLVEGDFDVVFNYAAQQWTSDLMFQNIKKIKAKKVIAPCGFSALNKIYSIKYFQMMPQWLREYDRVIFSSKHYQDYAFASKHKVDNIHIISNAASRKEFETPPEKIIRKKFNIKINHNFIVLIGTHTGTKGHGDAIKIFKKADIRNSTLFIIANSIGTGCQQQCAQSMQAFNSLKHSKDHNQRIIVTSLSRDETIASLFEADLFLFPSKIECAPLVIYESMAAGTPFLVTNVGNTKEIVLDTNAGEIMPTIRKGSRAFPIVWLSALNMKKMISNKSKLSQMGELGRAAWKQQYTWEQVVNKYESIFNAVLS
jgi:glycosyltransferase involved in cell wall biosynthesis